MAATSERSTYEAGRRTLGLRPGELVRVRSAVEIAPTLDPDGSLDGMPFMPEMASYCGHTFRVSRRADKTCAGDGAARRMHDAVHLADLRCDGAAHGGCEAACLLFWKEAWLERTEEGEFEESSPAPDPAQVALTESLLPATTVGSSSEPLYRCQATEIPNASTPLRYRDLDQYARDVRNWGLAKVIRGLIIQAFNLWQGYSKRHLPPALRIAGGRSYPSLQGPFPVAKGATPKEELNLQPGDLVRIKSKAEIEATLDESLHNRGLGFDPEMVPYCGRTARVRARVNKIVDEHTGKLIEIKSDCIMLEGVVCTADFHLFCPRGIYSYWREIWLERVDALDAELNSEANGTSACPPSKQPVS